MAHTLKVKEVFMPYKTINELPESVQHVLPKHAQDIYKEAFDSAYKQYDKPKNAEEMRAEKKLLIK